MTNDILEDLEIGALIMTLVNAQKKQSDLITKMTNRLIKADPQFLNSITEDFKWLNHALESSYDRLSEYNAKKGKSE